MARKLRLDYKQDMLREYWVSIDGNQTDVFRGAQNSADQHGRTEWVVTHTGQIFEVTPDHPRSDAIRNMHHMPAGLAHDLLEQAWTLLSNAHGGDWNQAHPEWQQAVAKWRDSYFANLKGGK